VVKAQLESGKAWANMVTITLDGLEATAHIKEPDGSTSPCPGLL
jgi:hypothetical protein